MDNIENDSSDSDSDSNICNHYKKIYGETIWCKNRLNSNDKKCYNDVCSKCVIVCETCCGDKDEYKNKLCNLCIRICDKCNKKMCYYCEKRYNEGYGRCSNCWMISGICSYCDCTDAEYECERCYHKICYDHKKICFNCGTKCMDCHEIFANCNYCENDLSTNNVNEPKEDDENN